MIGTTITIVTKASASWAALDERSSSLEEGIAVDAAEVGDRE